jgi:hypothetical protein
MKEDELSMSRACSMRALGMINVYKIWLESLKGSDHSEELAIDGRIILEWILGK